MSGFENSIHTSPDVQRALWGIDPLAFQFAQEPNYQATLQDFLDTYDHIFTEIEALQGTEPLYTALSPTGALVQLRRRTKLDETVLPQHRIVAVTSALYDSTVHIWPEVTAVYEETRGQGRAAHYHLGYVPTELLIDLSLNTLEQARLIAEHFIREVGQRNSLPAVHFENDRYTVRWADGYTEPLSSARDMCTKISQVMERGLGAPALSVLANIPVELSEAG